MAEKSKNELERDFMYEATNKGKGHEALGGTSPSSSLESLSLDPMADLTPEYISKMDMNAPINDANNSLEMYGDDSSKENYNTLGGKAEKYTGEGVKTSDVPYDENITTEGLDPNYLFGKESKVYGTQHRGYISQRNDMIASALYNEGKTSMEDVADYLYQQKGFTNSTEDERKNTITSIWKRLGEMKGEPEENQTDSSAMEEELLGKEDEKIYGKTTPDSGKTEEGITALSDANNVYDMMSKERISNVKTLLSTPVESIAISLYKGDIPGDMQAIVDYKTFYPEQWTLVEQELKRLRGQGTVNALTKGETVPSNTNGTSAANNEIANFAASKATDSDSMSDILKGVHQTLQSNQAATSASETMADIESDIIDLTNRLQNLRKEANQIFKGDTPDYIVNAYINNRTQEIQNELKKLEQRYQYASNRYDKEVANTQWEKEYKLKERQVKVQEDEYDLKKWQAENGITTTTTDNKTTSATNPGDKYQVTTKSDAEVGEAVDNLVEMFNNGQLGKAQCGVGIQTYYLPMLGISISGISSLEGKKSLINEDKGYTPKKGDLIIINSGAKLEDGTPAGHIGIVIGVSEDGTIQYLDWNGSLGNDLKGTEEAAIRYIKMDNAKVLGFRNINKNYSDGSTSQTNLSNNQWTDTDYANFEKLLDPDASKTEIEGIALKYGYKDNVAALTQIARNALANRNNVVSSNTDTSSQGRVTVTKPDGTTVTYAYGVTANDPRLNEPGFDPVLGYNLNKVSDYEQLDKDYKLQEKASETEKQELQAFREARRNGVDVYADESRGIDPEYGFAMDKKDVYSRMNDKIANGKGEMPDASWKTFMKELGFKEDNASTREKASQELSNYNKWANETLEDPSVRRLIEELEYIIMQDATRPQRKLAMGDWGSIGKWGEAYDWANAYNYIVAEAVFDKLINTKSSGGTLTPVSDKDMERIENAAKNLKYDNSSDKFRQDINEIYKFIRSRVGMPITDKELDKMWNQEGTLPIMSHVNAYEQTSGDFSNYIMRDHAHKTGVLGGWNYGSKKTNAVKDTTTEEKPQYNFGGGNNTDYGTGKDILQSQLGN